MIPNASIRDGKSIGRRFNTPCRSYCRATSSGTAASTSRSRSRLEIARKLLVLTTLRVVFENVEAMHAKLDDGSLHIDEHCVKVLKGAGPRGYPGFAEVGNMPLPKNVLPKEITDMARIFDGRMSGTAYGAVVLHGSPEAAAGGR